MTINSLHVNIIFVAFMIIFKNKNLVRRMALLKFLQMSFRFLQTPLLPGITLDSQIIISASLFSLLQ